MVDNIDKIKPTTIEGKTAAVAKDESIAEREGNKDVERLTAESTATERDNEDISITLNGQADEMLENG